jgi:toxin ParE1/3/4
MRGGFRITPRAAQDLQNIARYTLHTWAASNATPTSTPLTGGSPGWRRTPASVARDRRSAKAISATPQGAHVIFYLVREGGIDIIGIPHQRMDVVNYFSGSS